MKFSANCFCGNVAVTLTLPLPLENYAPRQCDCDFCQQHQLTYISDATGHLGISSTTTLKNLKQGSDQGTFWQCEGCEQIIAVTYQSDNELRGAVNAQLFSPQHTFAQAIVVSPKLLSPSEKRQRWSTMWLTVTFMELASA